MHPSRYIFLLLASLTTAETPDEFKIKRESVFEFTEKPRVTKQKGHFLISFASKGYCDATVALEDASSRIVRHLASGVLGKNAPPPFQKNTLKQVVAWDGKDDRGEYVKEFEGLTVRVSLGLKPQFERTLYWSPHKRISNIAPIMVARPEGIYAFEGLGVDHLRLFDHDGEYLRTIYPFSEEAIEKVVGMQTHTFVQDGQTMPLKEGYEQTTLLTSGSSFHGSEGHDGGFAATSMAIHNDRIALASHELNRLATDGTSGGLPFRGPSVSFAEKGHENRKVAVGPTSMAFSPDGRFLYMTGFVWKTGAYDSHADAFHTVMRLEHEKPDSPEVFLGSTDKSKYGSGNDQFCVPTSVACDSKGRVYVSDFVNNRIQVFSPEGVYLKSLKTPLPANVQVDPKTDEIWVFSWPVIGPTAAIMKQYDISFRNMPATVVRLGTFENPQSSKPEQLPVGQGEGGGGWIATGGQVYQATVDFHAGAPRLWIVGRKPTLSMAEANWMTGDGLGKFLGGGWMQRGIRVMTKTEGKWQVLRDFALETQNKVGRVTPPAFSRQRLNVNPLDGKLYVAEEQTGPGKSFFSILRIEPETGNIEEVKMPFDAEDLAFGIDGLVYLRTDREVVRYDSRNWREIPWDYGEERQKIGFISSAGAPRADAISALPIPGSRPVWYHSSGMWVSPRGSLAIFCNIRATPRERTPKDKWMYGGDHKEYTPHVYPGRYGNRVIHIYDPYGKLIHEDAIPGMTNADGLGIDADNNLYAMVAAPRMLEGKRYFDEKSETLIKFRPGTARFISSSESAPVQISDAQKPQRPADITKYGMSDTWAENAEWLYGGVGYGGQGGSCVCWHARFQLDYFARSFAPELRRYKVAVLDSNGNLILRIGRYGNVDDGVPLVAAGGPQNTKAMGGDEVSLFHGAYVGIHTDRRLFIHDAGNGRILSVKLGYHASETIALKDEVE
ncbi:MAG: hypothetical protein O3B01_08355 [Planctomycetota bacterium]|nr:hypothetical protein [Planctomycetota bacterium]MDA1138580.1 hypothetical protein [Planctomycetota bacterium]